MATDRRSLLKPLTRADFTALDRAEDTLKDIDQAITRAQQAGLDVSDLQSQAKQQREAILRLKRAYGGAA